MRIIKIDKRGFSLAELSVAIVIGTIVILTAAALGSIAYKSYNGLRSRSGAYNDSQFALQLIRESVRESTSAPTVAANSLTLVTAQCTTIHFYVPSGTSNLVYASTCGATTKPATTIVSGVTAFTPDISALPLVSVTLTGTANGVAFNYVMRTSRRNP